MTEIITPVYDKATTIDFISEILLWLYNNFPLLKNFVNNITTILGLCIFIASFVFTSIFLKITIIKYSNLFLIFMIALTVSYIIVGLIP